MKVETLAKEAITLANSGTKLDALTTALEAAHQLKENKITKSKTQNWVSAALLSSLVSDRSELVRFSGKEHWINAKFSPDGESVVTVDRDKHIVKLWGKDGTPLRTIRTAAEQGESVHDVQFSPDGYMLISSFFGDDFSTVKTRATIQTKIWRQDGTFLSTFKGFDPRFSSNGRNIITSDVTTGSVKILLWQTDGTLIGSLGEGGGQESSFSPDGETIVVGGDTVSLWSSSGTLLHTLEGHSDQVRAAEFSPDGETVATADMSGTIMLWKTDGTLFHTLESHSEHIDVLKFSPDGEMVATADTSGTTMLWGIDGTLLHTLEGQSESVHEIRFNSDRETITLYKSAHKKCDDTVEIWRSDGVLVNTLEGFSLARFSPDGETIATYCHGELSLWQADGTPLSRVKTKAIVVNDISFSSDGPVFLHTDNSGSAKLQHADDGTLVDIQGHLQTLEEASNTTFSPDGRVIATTNYNSFSTTDVDNRLKLWNAEGELLHELTTDYGAVAFSPDSSIVVTREGNTKKLWGTDGTQLPIQGSDVHFSPDGNTVATRTPEKGVRLWQADGTFLRTLGETYEQIVGFSSNGRTIATSSVDEVRLWQYDGTLLDTINVEGYDISLSPDGHTIIARDSDDIKNGHDVNLVRTDGRLLHTFKVDRSHKSELSHDGKLIYAPSDDGKVWTTDGDLIYPLENDSQKQTASKQFQFNTNNGTFTISFPGENSELWSADGTFLGTLDGFVEAFSPDGDIIVTHDPSKGNYPIGTSLFWHSDGIPLSTVAMGKDVVFSPDNATIASSSESKVKLWPWGVDSLKDHTCQQIRSYLHSSSFVESEDRRLCG